MQFLMSENQKHDLIQEIQFKNEQIRQLNETLQQKQLELVGVSNYAIELKSLLINPVLLVRKIIRKLKNLLINFKWFMNFRNLFSSKIKLSIVVVCYNMAEEIINTVYSLSDKYQNINVQDYEIIVIDNGSTDGIQAEDIIRLGKNIRFVVNP